VNPHNFFTELKRRNDRFCVSFGSGAVPTLTENQLSGNMAK